MITRLIAPLVLATLLMGCSGMPISQQTQAADEAQSAQQQPKTLYLNVITGLRDRGLYRAALAHLDEYEKLNGVASNTVLLRGQLLLDIGAMDDALVAFKSITAEPEMAAAQSGIGTIAARTGQWNDAVAAFTEAVRREPTNARYINNLGFALLHAGDVDKADYRLRMAAELDPNSAEIRNNLALLLLATNHKADGERLLAQVEDATVQTAIRREAAKVQKQLASGGEPAPKPVATAAVKAPIAAPTPSLPPVTPVAASVRAPSSSVQASSSAPASTPASETASEHASSSPSPTISMSSAQPSSSLEPTKGAP